MSGTVGRPRRPWDRVAPHEREYFDLLGPGLVAVVPGRPQGSRPGGWSPPTGGAWVHVGADGRIRGFSGKVEVGQGTQMALALLVAEELRVAPDRVEVVLGDTDLCPWDIGTFGSRSMPDAGPDLAAAAAGAREKLEELAAARTGRDRGSLTAHDGAIGGEGDRPLPYAELVRDGRHRVLVDRSIARTPARDWGTAGRPVRDTAAEDLVRGRTPFTSDHRLPGLLHGAILWPPTYGAELAEGPAEGVSTGEGATIVRHGPFIGAVGATAPLARAALGALPVRWRQPPQPGEAEIEGYLRTHPASGDDWDTDEEEEGDVDRALAGSAERVTATYRSAYLAHVPLEPHCAVAEWSEGRLTAWIGSQTPFAVRRTLARALELSEDGVRVIVPRTGTGFGGKHAGEVAVAAARLARAVARPVRVAFTREEEFRHAYFRPMSIVDVDAAVDRDGRLVAWKFHNVNGGAAGLAPPYRVPNRQVSNLLTDSPLPQGSYRALAANPNNFARESAVDELARHAGRDPVEFRMQNLDDERLRVVLQRAADRAHWAERPRTPGRGWGVAVGLEKGGRVATIARVHVGPDRRPRVERLVTVFEAGAIVHPANLRSQVEGSHVMALGGALFEAIHFRDGTIRNARLSEYRVPRFSDVPEIDVELVEAKDRPSEGGGESPMIAVAPAVANALFDATGLRLRSLPLVPSGRLPRPSSG